MAEPDNFSVAYWGGFGEVIATKLLYLNREGPNFRGIADALDARYDYAIEGLQSMEAAFDLDTAAGEQLDILGALLGLPRDGYGDDRYRRALKVQRSVILSSAGNRQSLIDVWTEWTGTAPLEYRNIPPAEVEIAGTVDDGDMYLLDLFLRKAAPAGVIINGFQMVDGDLLGDYEPLPIRKPASTVEHDLLFEPSLITLKDSVSGNIGTAVGSTPPSYDSTLEALDFPGIAGCTVRWTDEPADFSLYPPTVSAWINIDSRANGCKILGVRDSGGGYAYMVWVEPGGKLEIRHFTNGGTNMLLRGNTSLTKNEWYHVAFYHPLSGTATDGKIWLNGVEETYGVTTNGTLLRTPAGDWEIGPNENSKPPAAKIGPLFVHGVELTDAEVTELYGDPTGIMDNEPADSLDDAATLAANLE